jgi:hypothetical protein
MAPYRRVRNPVHLPAPQPRGRAVILQYPRLEADTDGVGWGGLWLFFLRGGMPWKGILQGKLLTDGDIVEVEVRI